MGTYLEILKELENEVISKYSEEIKSRKNPIIGIGGFSGTGKDTVAEYIQLFFRKYKNLELRIIGAGDIIRQIARESGYEEENLEKFTKLIQEDKKFAEETDIKIEKSTLKAALLEGGIFIGRMTPFVIGDYGTSIWLEVSAPIIAKRIASDKARPEYGLDTDIITEKIRIRDQTDGKRLEELYKVQFKDYISKFDLVIRNEEFSIEKLEERIFSFLKSKFS